jgi:S-adenosyl-L-methionine hydrolase (adenosine-forming)
LTLYQADRIISQIILKDFLMPVITLTTDFGDKDGFVGVLKGVIWGICPTAKIADITHAISPQNILEGALALSRAVPFFPPGTVHIAVVDPGVGTKRRPMAARLGEYFFVGPDNGLFTPMIEEAQRLNQIVEFIHLDKLEFWLPNVSHTFHGRDIFAPVAAHLAMGTSFSDLGTPFDNPALLELPKPIRTHNGWTSHVTIIDTFGNVTTDLPADLISNLDEVVFILRGKTITGLVDSYGWRKKGELIALVDSEGFVELAVVNGSAARELGVEVGDVVEVMLK